MKISRQIPKYWGSWKGRVLTAIALNGEQTWTELLEKTGLSFKALNRALSGLFNDKAVTKSAREAKKEADCKLRKNSPQETKKPKSL